MSEFKEQLSVANQYERWIAQGFKNVIEFNNDNKYDFKTEDGTTYEVKHDFQTATNNIAIEFECRNKPSCISVTEADYFIFIFPLLNEVWKIKTEKLKQLIKDFKEGLNEENWTSTLYYRDNVAGGDYEEKYKGKVSRLHLMKREDVQSHFKILKCKNIPDFKNV
jgi:hypothetical protein